MRFNWPAAKALIQCCVVPAIAFELFCLALEKWPILTLKAVAFGFGLLVIGAIRQKHFRKKFIRENSYWIAPAGRDEIEYQELRHGQWFKMKIYAELMVKGPRLIYVPTDEEWRAKAPEWAKRRQTVIFDRLRSFKGGAEFKVVDRSSTSMPT